MMVTLKNEDGTYTIREDLEWASIEWGGKDWIRATVFVETCSRCRRQWLYPIRCFGPWLCQSCIEHYQDLAAT